MCGLVVLMMCCKYFNFRTGWQAAGNIGYEINEKVGRQLNYSFCQANDHFHFLLGITQGRQKRTCKDLPLSRTSTSMYHGVDHVTRMNIRVAHMDVIRTDQRANKRTVSRESLHVFRFSPFSSPLHATFIFEADIFQFQNMKTRECLALK